VDGRLGRRGPRERRRPARVSPYAISARYADQAATADLATNATNADRADTADSLKNGLGAVTAAGLYKVGDALPWSAVTGRPSWMQTDGVNWADVIGGPTWVGSAPAACTGSSKLQWTGSAWACAVESDPKIGALTANRGCRTDGTSVICDQDLNAAPTTVSLTDAATITPDLATGRHFAVTLGGNRTIANPTNVGHGLYSFLVAQDATGGRTLTWGSKFRFNQSAPTLSSSANAKDPFLFLGDGDALYQIGGAPSLMSTPYVNHADTNWTVTTSASGNRSQASGKYAFSGSTYQVALSSTNASTHPNAWLTSNNLARSQANYWRGLGSSPQTDTMEMYFAGKDATITNLNLYSYPDTANYRYQNANLSFWNGSGWTIVAGIGTFAGSTQPGWSWTQANTPSTHTNTISFNGTADAAYSYRSTVWRVFYGSDLNNGADDVVHQNGAGNLSFRTFP
jgi:hypothetical protein